MIICVYYENEVHITWDKVPEADGYKIYQKTGDHLYTSFKEVLDNKVSLFGMLGAELKIKPYKLLNDKREYVFGETKFSLKNDVFVDKFETLVNISKSSARILWKPILNANFYKVYQNGEFVGESTYNEYIARMLPCGTSQFTIEAYNGAELITTSDLIPVTINDLELFSINKDGKVFLYWNKVNNIDGYRIFKKELNGEFCAFQSESDENAYVENIFAGEIAEFKVKPYILKAGQREFTGLSAKCKVNVYKTSNINLMINEAYDNKLSLSWYFDGDVDGYEIYRNDNLIDNIEDGLAHIALIDYIEGDYKIKGYKKYYDEIIYTCESDNVSCLSYRLSQTKPINYKLSVIIPAYNSEEYISRTIATVLGSTLDAIELVIVDDESKDNTREVLSWYAEKYPDYVKTIFKKNGGVAHTRNVGIEFAHGEFIAFMDNDDMIRPNGFKELYDAITSTDSDIAVAPLYRIDNDRYVVRHRLPFKVDVAHDIEDYLRLVFSDGYNNIGVWNKLYKAELVKSHPFGLLAYEDVSWTPYILSFADKFCYINNICYEWDRKIRTATFSNVLSNRSAEEKFKERFEAFEFFYKQGNQNRKECLAYVKAKRLYGQGTSAKYHKYFEAISDMKDELINNKFLLADKKACERIMPLLEN